MTKEPRWKKVKRIDLEFRGENNLMRKIAKLSRK